MSTTAASTTAPTRPATPRLVRTGAVAAAIAAVATTAVAAAAGAADVPFEVDGEEIPISAYAWWTVIATVLGVVLAKILRDRRRFVAVTVVLTALSLIPAVAAPDHTATKVVLVATHLLAAAVVIPALSRELSPR